jgi:threonine/homoserine/homoserine lactone efflux protein
VSTDLAFVAVAVAVMLAPGADFAVVVRNTLAGDRVRGTATALGITASTVLQGLAAAAGLGALVTASQPVFDAIRWTGNAYLAWLAVQAFRSAWRGDYREQAAAPASRGFRQGFLSNITNPKVLVFYLAVLPQFIAADTSVVLLVLVASTHAVLGLGYLLGLVLVLERARRWLSRRRVRRGLDVLTGTMLGAIGVRLATE